MGPLRLSVEATAAAVLDVLTEEMVGAIEQITVHQGIDPARAVLVAGGGASGFDAVAIACRLGYCAVLFPPTGAALSAAGASQSNLVFTDGRILQLHSDAPDAAGVAAVLASLAASMRDLVAASGGTGHRIDWWVEARYPQQTSEIQVPLEGLEWSGPDALARAVAGFRAAYQALCAVSDPTAPVEFLAWRARANSSLGDGGGNVLSETNSVAGSGMRRAFLTAAGWSDVPVLSPGRLRREPLAGPAILESPFTTIVVPPGATARRLASGTIEVTP